MPELWQCPGLFQYIEIHPVKPFRYGEYGQEEATLTSNIKKIMEKEGVAVRALMESTGLSGETVMRARKDQIHLCRLHALEAIAKCPQGKVKALFDEE